MFRRVLPHPAAGPDADGTGSGVRRIVGASGEGSGRARWNRGGGMNDGKRMKVSRLEPNQAGVVDWPTLSVSKGSVVTVGEFDGVHRGHQAVISRAVGLARRQGDYAVAVMFEPRPKRVHRYAASHAMADLPEELARQDDEALMGLDERIRLLGRMGIDRVLIVRYTMAFAAKSYRFFLGQMVRGLGMSTLVLGRDARLGAGLKGDVAAIQALAQETGTFCLEVVDDMGPGYVDLTSEGEEAGPRVRVWSTSNARRLLSLGRVEDAGAVLGRPHIVEGEVIHGEQRGRELGYPTANLSSRHTGYMPADGVYAGWLVDMGPADASKEGRLFDEEARLAAGSPWRWPAAISIGTKETFEDETGLRERVLEVNAVTADWLELYGHRVRVEFLRHLRPQEKYSGAEALKVQLGLDAAQTLKVTGRDPR